MEKQLIFYGHYEAKNMKIFSIPTYTFHYIMPLAYLLVMISIFLVSLVLMVRRTAKSVKTNLLNRSEGNLFKYNHMIFCGWDYTLEKDKAVKLKHLGLHKEILSELWEDIDKTRRENLSRGKKCGLWTLRVLVNVIVLAFLAGAAYLIIYATQESLKFKEEADYEKQPVMLRFLMEYMTSIVITVLNFIIPFIFSKLVLLEDFKIETQIKLTLIRTVILKLASIGVTVGTLYGQVTCSGPRDYCHVSYTSKCPELRCWETYIGQQIYKLIIMQFLVSFVVIIFVEFPRKLFVSKCPCKLCKVIGLPEFDLPNNVLDLVYGQALCWLAVFVCPLAPGITFLKCFIMFYLKKGSLLINYTPSTQPYKTSRSNMFFVVIMITAFLGCCIPIFYTIWRVEPSHGCGPFRLYLHDIDIWDITVDTFPGILKDIVQFLQSAPLIFILLLCLSMGLYFSKQLVGAYGDMTSTLRKQLANESKDSQFYKSKLVNITGKWNISGRKTGRRIKRRK